jgi:mRNA-degrading endonuclease YafQ of YafQ-DinJ toxin-antitoxin module
MIIDEVIFHLFNGTAKYDRSFTYEELSKNWKDSRECPTKDAMWDCWNEMVEKLKLKHPFYYKLKDKKWVLDSSKQQDLKEKIILIKNSETSKKGYSILDKLLLGITKVTTRDEFLDALFKEFKSCALDNDADKKKLENKKMSELMDIYNNL